MAACLLRPRLAMVEALGWLSSVVLLATILNQVHAQWTCSRDQNSSVWLFAGQAVASSGFTAYSWLLRNWVFTVTNGMLLVSAVVGYRIASRQKRSPRSCAMGHNLSVETETR